MSEHVRWKYGQERLKGQEVDTGPEPVESVEEVGKQADSGVANLE